MRGGEDGGEVEETEGGKGLQLFQEVDRVAEIWQVNDALFVNTVHCYLFSSSISQPSTCHYC